MLSGLQLLVGGRPIEALEVARRRQRRHVRGPTGTTADRRRLLVVAGDRSSPCWPRTSSCASSRGEPTTCEVRVERAANLADLFSVKEGRAHVHGQHTVEVGPSLWHRWEMGDVRRTTSITPAIAPDEGAVSLDAGGFTWTVDVPARGVTRLRWTVDVAIGSEWIDRSLGPLVRRASTATQAAWAADAPSIDTDDPVLARAYRRSIQDLGSLRLFDPSGRRRPVVAAGAPWFMTLFGRDASLTAWMALILDPSLALRRCRRWRGSRARDVPEPDEQPGRILHEVRFDSRPPLALDDADIYYGSVDATPLFVMLLERWRWGTPSRRVGATAPRRRPRAWRGSTAPVIATATATSSTCGPPPQGLEQPGMEGLLRRHPLRRRRPRRAPIALCEVQAYVYAAYSARRASPPKRATIRDAPAPRRGHASSKDQFNRDFWLDERGLATRSASIASKRPSAPAASNMGHCLWAGIVDDERAAQVSSGCTTRASGAGGVSARSRPPMAYDPLSYHNGSVWPHDTTIGIAGLPATALASRSPWSTGSCRG